MKGSSEKHTISEQTFVYHARKQLQPFKILLIFLLTALACIFVALTAAFVYTYVQTGSTANVRLPLIFHANTLVLLISSVTIHQIVAGLEKDDQQQYRAGLSLTLMLGCSFIIFQFLGWRKLLDSGIGFSSSPAGSYLYLISGLHVLHVAAGIVTLSFMLIKSYLRMNDPVKALLFCTDATQPQKARLMTTYWHFVDGLWLYLYFFFLVMI